MSLALIVIEPGESICTKCGRFGELRPFGKGYWWECMACLAKDPEHEQRMIEMSDGRPMFTGHMWGCQ